MAGRHHRNGWPDGAGISGRDGPEQAAGIRRNTHISPLEQHAATFGKFPQGIG